MAVNYWLVFSFFLYRMYMNLCLVYAWLSSVISFLNYKSNYTKIHRFPKGELARMWSVDSTVDVLYCVLFSSFS